MSTIKKNEDGRRDVLKLLGGTAVLLPLAGLAGCSGEKESSEAMPAKAEDAADKAMDTMEDTMDEAADAAETAAEEVKEATQADSGMPLLDENGSQAQSLGYVHDASTVDTEKYPRYQDGQACSNCALYTGGDAAQGGCSIFPGKAVKATGWCNVYAPKAG